MVLLANNLQTIFRPLLHPCLPMGDDLLCDEKGMSMDVEKSEQIGWMETEINGVKIRAHPYLLPMFSEDGGKTWRDLEPQTHIITKDGTRIPVAGGEGYDIKITTNQSARGE